MSKQIKDRPSYILREFDKSLFNASYFGFTPIEAPHVSNKDIESTKDWGSDAYDKAAFLRFYTEKEFANLPHPITVCYKKRDAGKRTYTHCLHVIGQNSALAEAMLIRTTLSILEERGFEHTVVEINSMGDKDSIATYEKELHQYVKKISAELDTDQKKILKDDVFELLNLKLTDNLKEKIPPSLASLTTQSRAHFKEMLEYLEALGVDFRLAHTLIGNRNFASHTIFNIRDTESQTILAEGFRYTRLTKRMGFRKETPAVSVTIFDQYKKPSTNERAYKELSKPKFYLIQLGQDAKMKSLPLIELLRQNHIAVYHFLGKDKIIPQLSQSESLRVPYLLVLGQKEAIDNTVTVRNVSTRAQETVKMCDLPAYLKKISL